MHWWFATASVAVTTVTIAALGQAPRQLCDPPHYRWSVKIDTTLATRRPVSASIPEILSRWAPPTLGRDDRCAPRVGRELSVYAVRGWIRRIEKSKDDGDWHIELTAGPSSPPESCIVAEIPLGDLGAVYRRSRAQLDGVVATRKIARDGDLKPPLEVWLTGAAFYDGQHRRTTRKHDETDQGHGRCNSSVRALWELHPVYAVRKP